MNLTKIGKWIMVVGIAFTCILSVVLGDRDDLHASEGEVMEIQGNITLADQSDQSDAANAMVCAKGNCVNATATGDFMLSVPVSLEELTTGVVISASLEGYSITPGTDGTYLYTSANITPGFSFTKNVEQLTFQVSGTIQTENQEAIDASIQVSGGTAQSSTNGAFSITLDKDYTGELRPVLEGYTFEPVEYTVVALNADVNNIAFVAKPTPPPVETLNPVIINDKKVDGETMELYPNDAKVSISISTIDEGTTLFYQMASEGEVKTYTAPFEVTALSKEENSVTIFAYSEKDELQSDPVSKCIKFAKASQEPNPDDEDKVDTGFVDEEGNAIDAKKVKLNFDTMVADQITSVKEAIAKQSVFKEVEAKNITFLEISLTADQTSVQPTKRYDFVIPYPTGTNEKDTFHILHMVQGTTPEVVEGENKSDGLHLSVDSFSPFAIGWIKYVEPTPTPDPDEGLPEKDKIDNTLKDNGLSGYQNENVSTGDCNSMLFYGSMMLSALGMICLLHNRSNQISVKVGKKD